MDRKYPPIPTRARTAVRQLVRSHHDWENWLLATGIVSRNVTNEQLWAFARVVGIWWEVGMLCGKARSTTARLATRRRNKRKRLAAAKRNYAELKKLGLERRA